MPPMFGNFRQQEDDRSLARPRRGSVPELKEKRTVQGPRANQLFKTKMCNNWAVSGTCPYGLKCQFAHGAAELAKWEAWRVARQQQQDVNGKEELHPGGSRLGSFRFDTGSSDEGLDGPSLGGVRLGNRFSDLSLETRSRSRSEHDDFEHRQLGGRIMSWQGGTSHITPVKQQQAAPLFSPGENFSLWSSSRLVESKEDSPQHDSRSRAGTLDSADSAPQRNAPANFYSQERSNAPQQQHPPTQERINAPNMLSQPPVNLDFLL